MMRRILSLLLLVLACQAAQAEVWQARYGVAETFNFKLYNADGTLDVDEADGGTEVSVSCNEGAETTATNDFVDEGTFYSIALTATEMQCERVAVVIAATTTEVFFIQTSANASAMTPSYEANVGTITDGAIVAADFGTGAITATAIAADAIGASEIAAGAIDAGAFASGAIDATAIAADAIGASELATDAIGAAEIAANAIAAAEIADSAIDNATFSCSGGSFPILGVTDCGTAQSADADEIVIRSGATFADSEVIGQTVLIGSATTGSGQSVTVDTNTGTSDTLNVGAWPATTPTGTITYYLFGTAAGSGAGGEVTVAAGGITSGSFASGAITATAIAADAIGASEVADGAIDAGALASDAITAAKIANAAIDAATFASGAIDATAIAADAIGSSEIAADAIGASELATDAIGAAEIAANAVGASEVADNAIDAASTAADFSTEVQDVDVESINGANVCGDGTDGTPWADCP